MAGSESVDTPHASSPLAAEVASPLDLLDDLQAKLASLRTWKQEQAQQMQQLEQWNATLDDKQRSLEHLGRELQALEQELVNRRQTLDQRERELNERTAHVDQGHAELARQRDEHAGRQRQQDESRSQLDEQWARYHGQRDELDRAWQQFHEEKRQWQSEVDALEARRQQLDALAAQLDERRAHIEEELKQIDEEWQRIDERRKAQDQLAQTLEQDRRRIEQLRHRHGDAVASADPEQVATLTRELAQQKNLANDQATRIEELEAQLAEAGEAVSHHAQAAQQAQALRTELASMREQAARQQEELTAMQQLLDEAAAATPAPAPTPGPATPSDDPAWRKELEQLQHALAQRERLLAEKEQELEHRKQKLQGKVEAAKRELVTQRDELESMRRQLAAHQSGQPVPVVVPGRDPMNTRRRQRLAKVKLLLQEKRSGLRQEQDKLTTLQRHYASLLDQRKVVLEVKQYLEASEAVMVQRWAGHRAITLVFAIVMTLGVIAAVCYKAVYELTPLTWQSQAVLELTPRHEQVTLNLTNTDELAAQRKIAFSEPVMRETLNQLNTRGVRGYTSTAELATDLQARATFTSPHERRMAITLQGTDTQRLQVTLDAMTKAFTTFHTSQPATAPQALNAQTIEAPTVAAEPVSDPRLRMFGKWFGIASGATLLVSLLIWALLRRSSRVLDAEANPLIGALENDTNWPKERH